MAAPSVVAAPTETGDPTNGTSFDVSLPATVNSGELLLIVMGARQAGTSTFTFAESGSSDFTEKHDSAADTTGGGAYNGIAVYARTADGTEGGGTVTFATSETVIALATHCFRITGGDIDNIEVTAGNANAASFYDPPAHTPSGGSDDYLYLAACIASDDDASFSDFPDGYSGGVYTQTGGGTNSSVTLATCYKQTTGSTSDNPNTFGLSELEGVYGFTMSIGPSGGGGGGVNLLAAAHYHRIHNR